MQHKILQKCTSKCKNTANSELHPVAGIASKRGSAPIRTKRTPIPRIDHRLRTKPASENGAGPGKSALIP
jgi:hypothetical protein